MAHGIIQKLTGREGRVEIEALGALIGTINHYTLARRGDDGPRADLFDFHAVLSYVNEALWDDEDYTKSIVIRVGKNELFRLEQAPEFVWVRDGKGLEMQGVKLTNA